jgi:GTP pyrophosphokinase
MLHDAVEDIDGVTLRMIENLYGTKVATMVDLVTKKSDRNYKDNGTMILYLHDIAQNRGASLIKTADRKHNFSTLLDATLEKRMKQAIETEKFFIPFFKKCRNMYPRYAHYFFAAKTAIEPHLWAIKEYQSSISQLQAQFDEIKKHVAEQV